MAPTQPNASSSRKACEAFFTWEIAELRDIPGTSRVVDARNEMANALRERLSRDGELVREQDTRQWQVFFIPPGSVSKACFQKLVDTNVDCFHSCSTHAAR
jgi:hypothetical protein